MSKVYVFHTDPGHGWLAVKIAELRELNILNEISSRSYVKGATVYLEGDRDAWLFVNAKKKIDPDFKLNYRSSFREYTPIRRYNIFNINSL